MKIAILGGAFDPPTFGHIHLAECILSNLNFDEIWMMPVFKHTFDKNMTDFNHRLNMCLIATEHNSKIKVSFYEAQNNHFDGTLSLFKKLTKAYNHEFYMVIGMDNANLIDKWVNPEELIKTVPFIVVTRKGFEQNPEIDWYLKKPHTYLESCDTMEISSTRIRKAIKENDEELLQYGLHHLVKNYIEDYELYL